LAEKDFLGRIDLSTVYNKDVLNNARELDLANLKKRIDERDSFLKEKLGEIPPKNQPAIFKGISNKDIIDELGLVSGYLKENNIYNNYYRNFLLSCIVWDQLTKESTHEDYKKYISYGEKALSVESGQRLKDDYDSLNILNYRLASTNIDIGKTDKALKYVDDFSKGLRTVFSVKRIRHS
jgi:hypothetical protein